MGIPVALEDRGCVEAFDAWLRAHPREVLQHARTVRDRYTQLGYDVLDWHGWPLRPLFVPAPVLEFIGHGVHQQVARFVACLQSLDPAEVAQRVPLPLEFLSAIDLAGGLASPDFLALLRPDGFLSEAGFVLSELNFGNGTLVSNAYSEVLYELLAESPLMGRLQTRWHIHRPFQAFLTYLGQRFPPPCRLALLAHSDEYRTIQGWEARVMHQVANARRLMAVAGFATSIVHEDGLTVHEDGSVSAPEGPVAGVVQLTIGTPFLDAPERLRTDFRMFSGASIGRVPWIKPLASLCLDKGAMPALQSMVEWPVPGPAGFEVNMAGTEFPQPSRATEYRLGKDALVLKRAFDGKDTRVGLATPPRIWNRTLDVALASRQYVLQEYHSLPRTTLPITKDGETIEWIDVRVEVSPFLVDGRYAGAIARYAPDEEGLVMSPPPPAMGMTLVCATQP